MGAHCVRAHTHTHTSHLHRTNPSPQLTLNCCHHASKGESTVIRGHTGSVRSVCFAPNQRMLLTGSDDKTLKVWGLPTRRFQACLQGHGNWVRTGVFSPDARLVLSGSDDKTVKLWDLAKRECLHTYYDHTG